MTPFQEWLDGQVVTVGQAGLAKKLGVDDSAVHAWLYRGTLPSPDHEARLAGATGTDLETIQALVDRSWRQQRAELNNRRKRRLARAGAGETTIQSATSRMPLSRAGITLPRSRLSRTAAAPA